MNENQLQSMQGQLHALSITLSSVMSTLQPPEAAQAAAHLKRALEEAKAEDLEQQTPQVQADARNMVANACCDLLSAVSRAG